MGAFVFCLFYFVGMFIVSAIVGTTLTTPGVFAAFVVGTTVFAAADLSVYLVRGPLHRMSSALLRVRELGALLIVLFMFAVVGGITGGVILGWSSLAPVAFSTNPLPVHEAFRLGFSAAIISGVLNAVGFPNRFAALAKLAERHMPRDDGR